MGPQKSYEHAQAPVGKIEGVQSILSHAEARSPTLFAKAGQKDYPPAGSPEPRLPDRAAARTPRGGSAPAW
ncbi:hypothetical protein GCM10020254_56740 [Streptomyces goshikiensis]